MSSIELKNIVKAYSDGEKTNVILNKINLLVKEGESIVITGSSGSGKSTLLKIMACLESFDHGEYWLENKRILPCDDRVRAKCRKDSFGYIPQDNKILTNMSVYDNIALPLYLANEHDNKIYTRVMELVDVLDIGDLLKRDAGKLSLGERQRVCMARALVKKPKFLFADEPTASLDEKNRERVHKLLEQLKSQRTGIVVVTHEASLIEQFDKKYELSGGKLIYLSENE